MAPLDRFCHSTGRRLWYCRCAWRWTAAPLGAQIQGKSNSLNQRFSWFSWEPDTSCSLNHHLPNLGDRSVFQIHKMCKILIFVCVAWIIYGLGWCSGRLMLKSEVHTPQFESLRSQRCCAGTLKPVKTCFGIKGLRCFRNSKFIEVNLCRFHDESRSPLTWVDS